MISQCLDLLSVVGEASLTKAGNNIFEIMTVLVIRMMNYFTLFKPVKLSIITRIS